MTTACNLPAEPNPFVGRESDVDELAQLLGVAPVVTLCGAGGIGKTRLAIRVAARLAPRFPGGARLVDLTAARPDERVSDLVGAVAPLPDPAADRRTLIVLDGCEQAVAERAELCRVLFDAGPGSTVLATGREPLRVPGETVWRVPPLSLGGDQRRSEAVRLFLARATAAGPDRELTDETLPLVSRLCRALDGLPLAIELAAALVGEVTLAELAELGDRLRAPAGGAPTRRATLWAVVDLSYLLLPEQARVLLRRLAVCRSRWTLDQAERVCTGPGLPAEHVLPRLRDLVGRSLVVADGERGYRLPAPVREYAAGRLAESGEEAVLIAARLGERR